MRTPGLRRAAVALAIGLLLAAALLVLGDRDSSQAGLPVALRHEAIRQIKALPLIGAEVVEIDCRPMAGGHVACPALLETRNGSGRLVYHLGRGQEQGELTVESIKLTEASAQLIRSQF